MKGGEKKVTRIGSGMKERLYMVGVEGTPQLV